MSYTTVLEKPVKNTNHKMRDVDRARLSPTAIEVDGITLDLNRVTRSEFRGFEKTINRLLKEHTEENDKEEEVEQIQGDFYSKIIVAWPFGEIKADSYGKLGTLDAGRVDAAWEEVSKIMLEKKLQSSLKPPGSTDGPSETLPTLEPTLPDSPPMNTTG